MQREVPMPIDYRIFIFEIMPDGSRLWRGCVPDRGAIDGRIQELGRTKKAFFAIDIETGETVSMMDDNP